MNIVPLFKFMHAVPDSQVQQELKPVKLGPPEMTIIPVVN